MAGDWTPIEHATPRKPEVMNLVTLTSRSRHEVVGLLVDFWCWVDEHTPDGNINVPITSLPHLIGADDDFWSAVESIGWLISDGTAIRIPNADHWLTIGAKSRLLATRRQQQRRARVTKMSRSKRDNGVTKTRLQNRTEQNSNREINTHRTFAKPSLEEVREYVAERSSSVDAEAFMAYYTANGWRVGKNPMKDWRAAVVTWERNSNGKHGTREPVRQLSRVSAQAGSIDAIKAKTIRAAENGDGSGGKGPAGGQAESRGDTGSRSPGDPKLFNG